MVTIVDYNAGNIGSIKNMLSKLGVDSIITSEVDKIERASYLILPGVGAFDYGVEMLSKLNLLDVLNFKRKEGTPILGICLGAQLMCQSSEEGTLKGLGWVHARVKRFPHTLNEKRMIVPHMGWDFVAPVKQSRIFREMGHLSRFYFVHSYFIDCEKNEDVLAINNYGVNFHSAFEVGNIVGVQFHPEKSHDFGKQLLKNFIEGTNGIA